MFDSQYLLASDAGATSVYSPWMSRGGDNMRFTLDLVDITGGGELSVDVFHKNSDQTGDGTSAGGVTTNSMGRVTVEALGMRELVRYKYTLSVESGDTTALFRMLTPVWFDAVEA